MEVRTLDDLKKAVKVSPNRLLLQIVRGGTGLFLVLQ
jgi:hypothetical protein